MNTDSVSWLVKWLPLPRRAQTFDAGSSDVHHYKLSTEIGTGERRTLRLFPGVFVDHDRFKIRLSALKNSTPLATFSAQFDEPALLLQSPLHGQYRLSTSGATHEMLPKTLLFMFGESTSFELALNGNLSRKKDGFELEILTIRISRSQLSDLLGDEGQAKAFTTRLKDEGAPKPVIWNITQAIADALVSCGTLHRPHPHDLLRMRGGLCEFLRLLLIQSANRDHKDRRDDQRIDRIQSIHDFLLTLDGALPKLEELATEYGRSVVTLNKEFSAKFGQTITEFASEVRWNTAQTALLAGTPIKQIADRVGFEKVGNFNAAFRKRFGMPPGKFRTMTRSTT